MKPNCRILWAGNLLMSDLTFGPSFKVKRWFTGFGELSFWWIQICIGSPMRRSSYWCYRFANVKQTKRKSWARNLLMGSNVTLDPSFKVK